MESLLTTSHQKREPESTRLDGYGYTVQVEPVRVAKDMLNSSLAAARGRSQGSARQVLWGFGAPGLMSGGLMTPVLSREPRAPLPPAPGAQKQTLTLDIRPSPSCI